MFLGHTNYNKCTNNYYYFRDIVEYSESKFDEFSVSVNQLKADIQQLRYLMTRDPDPVFKMSSYSDPGFKKWFDPDPALKLVWIRIRFSNLCRIWIRSKRVNEYSIKISILLTFVSQEVKGEFY